MEDKNKKDIVDEMIHRFKSTDEYPYREGSWENFRANHTQKVKSYSWGYWSAAAAIVVLLGLGYVFQKNNSLHEEKLAQLNEHSEVLPNTAGQDTPTLKEADEFLDKNATIVASENKAVGMDQEIDRNLELVYVEQTQENSNITLNLDPYIRADLPNTLPAISSIKKEEKIVIANNIHIPSQLAFDELGPSYVELKVDELPNNKNFHLSDKFNASAFVSPNSTNQKVKVGGGLMLAYNLTNKLSVRTGIAYHEYEVGIVQDPTKASSTEIVAAENVNHKSSQNLLLGSTAVNSNFVAIPNVNAVTGMVQSLDIPLELSYRVTKNLYAVGGLSYAPVLNQKRYIQYIENVNTDTFVGGIPNNQAAVESATNIVTKSTESSEKNVSTNGFGGFVNFSVGRKLDVNKKFSVSLEPFIKLPVGKFRVSEMNYTNGGLRIITSF